MTENALTWSVAIEQHADGLYVKTEFDGKPCASYGPLADSATARMVRDAVAGALRQAFAGILAELGAKVKA